MLDGTEKEITTIKVGEETRGGTVQAKMEFEPQVIYNYMGVEVSGSHWVIEDNQFVAVENSKRGIRTDKVEPVHTFKTSDNKWVEPEKVKMRLLRECGIFVQHSITDPVTGDDEGLPAAIQEAMAHGLAVVSTRHSGIPEAVVELQDLAGDGNHYSATITSSQFSGKSKIEQHKMVYNSLKGRMGNELHALAIKTKEN